MIDLPAVDRDRLLGGLAALVEAHAIYRVKGFAHVPGKPMRLLVQGVGARFDSYYDASGSRPKPRRTRLVFIGRRTRQRPRCAPACRAPSPDVMHLLTTRPGGFVEDEGAVVRLGQYAGRASWCSARRRHHARAARRGPGARALAAVAAARERDVPETAGVARPLHRRGAAARWSWWWTTSAPSRRGPTASSGSGNWRAPAASARCSRATSRRTRTCCARARPPIDWCRTLWHYFCARSGPAGAPCCCRSLAFHGLGQGPAPEPPRPVAPGSRARAGPHGPLDLGDITAGWTSRRAGRRDNVFYRSHLQSGNTAAFDALAGALRERGLNPLPVAARFAEGPGVHRRAAPAVRRPRGVARDERPPPSRRSPTPAASPLAGDAPVLQVIVSGATRDDWLADPQGLRPRDIAMQVALPEVDGRIVTRAISFKGLAWRCELTQTDIAGYQPDAERVGVRGRPRAALVPAARRGRSAEAPRARAGELPRQEAASAAAWASTPPASVVNILGRLAAGGYAVRRPAAGRRR